jgi:peptide/nickel transport system ATP-binding protein
MTDPLLSIQNLIKDYPLAQKRIFGKAAVYRALRGINLELKQGVSFGVVGESGCGKSTLARIVMALDSPTSGSVYFQKNSLFQISPKQLNHLRKHFQMVFQDPYGSLNPRKPILKIVAEPLRTLKFRLSRGEIKDRVQEILEEVGLNPNDISKYPHEFSGGQRQRIAIARALITKPSLIVADESVSALDVSVQAQVLNLLIDLQEKYGLTYLFISHDLSVVEYITDEIAVIYNGKIVEKGNTPEVFKTPLHPYTKALLAAVPNMDPKTKSNRIVRQAIDLSTPTRGCPFRLRCLQTDTICARIDPELKDQGDHFVACHKA